MHYFCQLKEESLRVEACAAEAWQSKICTVAGLERAWRSAKQEKDNQGDWNGNIYLSNM